MLARASMATVASGGRDVARATSRRAVVAPRGRRATPSPTSSASPRRSSRDAPSRTRSRRAARRLVLATPPSRSGVGDSVDVEVLDPSAERGSTRDDVVAGAESPTTAGALATGDDSDKRGPTPSSSALTLAGVPVTPEIAAIVLVYFVQGILGLSRLAKDYFVKDELGLDPAQASLVFSLSSLPWLVKPLWGFVSDTVPLFGYRRKSYLALCGALGAASGFALCTVVRDVPGAAIAFTLGSLSTAFADVVIDSLVVARARGESQALSGSLQSLCWGSVALGGVASSYFSGSLIEEHGTRYVFGVTALFPLLIAFAAALVDEPPVSAPEATASRGSLLGGVSGTPSDDGFTDGGDPSPSSASDQSLLAQMKATGSKLWSVGRRRAVWAPTAFVFLWQATPNPGTAMFYFTTNELGFQPEFLGRVALARSVAALLGVGLYNAYLKDVPLRKMFSWSAILGAALGLTQLMLVTGYNRELGVPDQLFALGDTVVLTVLGEVSFLPVLVLAAKICPEGVEATLFAALMSVFNAGGVASGAAGAGLTSALGVTSDNFDNLFWLVLICNLSSLVPLLGLGWLDEAEKGGEESGGANDSNPSVE